MAANHKRRNMPYVSNKLGYQYTSDDLHCISEYFKRNFPELCGVTHNQQEDDVFSDFMDDTFDDFFDDFSDNGRNTNANRAGTFTLPDSIIPVRNQNNLPAQNIVSTNTIRNRNNTSVTTKDVSRLANTTVTKKHENHSHSRQDRKTLLALIILVLIALIIARR
ncbi:hypothetical protein P6P90_03015 [Ectobacillus antri]|jgi:uncharacterized UPF0160 family protein|uniref:Uncharacterized protein n=1 Tax=Ectobacillus antri TaxID=2486280 RepID=A0ABT6H0R1_9BACI|nr:hypothetical protein [Ectobacillus antri]MDG4656295.1 hypothetical protein [Ectobacillus antri]MDG5752970.1 hypothetical protein [Ectobacillus antri]